jgi:hypothetical protein
MTGMATAITERVEPARLMRPNRTGVPLAWLAALLFGLLALDNLLLLRFLGKSWPLVAVTVSVGVALTMILALRCVTDAGRTTRVNWSTIAVCLAVACGLLILGGEGRMLYANTDWQVRDAVLADMGRHSWPFTYSVNGVPNLLRAPIGMYLLPALIGGASQAGLDYVLLACNTLMLGLLLAMGSSLFIGRRAQILALAVFISFSGLDAVGTALMRSIGIPVSLDHLEGWAPQLQYSSDITLIFWVPHHAIAGWLCALFFVLWQQRKVTIGAFAAVIPMVAIWSPLAIMGALPFAILAGLRTLIAREVRLQDIGQAAAALAIALPCIVYLQVDAARLPSGLRSLPPIVYVVSLAVEVIPYLIATFPLRRAGRFGRDTMLVVAACLAFMPLYRIAYSIDFQARASIMPLALLMLAVADVLTLNDTILGERQRRAFLVVVLCIGAITGAAELCRAFRERPSPAPRCTLLGIWFKQTGGTTAPYSTYLASAISMPWPLRPSAVSHVDTRHDPQYCWERPWRSSVS